MGPGSIIKRIKLENFMPYDSIEIFPGNYLNLVIGPNGTGKSSIVCCIIVGLAGEVSLTGRGSSPADFVKRGRDYGITEIELYDERGNYVIQRKIIITNRSQRKLEHKSEWKINDKSVFKAQVQSLTKKLNIKVDNLCQFLPQDSVTQFVKMNTCELLLNTLKAAGDNNLVDDHQKLIDYTKDIDQKSQLLESLEKSCKENEVNAQRLEAEVQQIKERDKLLKLRKICGQKIHYARYVECSENCDKAKSEFDKLRQDLVEVESSSQPFKDEADSYKKKYNEYKLSVDNTIAKSSSLTEKIRDYSKHIEQSKRDCQAEFARFRSKLEQEKSREQRLEMKYRELKTLQDRYKATEDVDLTEQLKGIESEIENIKNGRIILNKKKVEINDKLTEVVKKIELLKNESQLIQDIKLRKANLLRQRNAEAWQVMDWLSKNGDKFEQHVFNPIMCEINVKEPKFSRYVENAIPRNELTAFVCQTVNDVKTLTRIVREVLKLKINVILAPDKSMKEFEAEALKGPNLNHLGLPVYYLKDLIDAPEPILRYLCGSNNFHRIPVVENCPENKLSSLLNILPRLYANEEIYIINKSRYDGQTITSRDHIRDPTYLKYSLDTNRLAENKMKFQQYASERDNFDLDLKATIDTDDRLKRKWQDLVEEHRQLKTKHELKRKLENYIKKLEETIQEIEEEKIDIKTERDTLKKSVGYQNFQIMKHLERISGYNENILNNNKLTMLGLIMCKIYDRNHKIAMKRYRNSLKDSERLKETIRKSEQLVSTLESALEESKEAAEQNISGFKDGRLDSATIRRFNLIDQKTVEELTNRREDLTVRIDRIFSLSNNSAINEFNRQNEEARDKRLKIEDLRNSINNIVASRNKIKKTWLPRVKDVIDVINDNYAKFMRKLCYDGQVRLDFDSEKPDDFSAYGISILVRYRDNEQLIPLSSTRQSGGERSVATMIYMLALQTKTTAPFRCVDEINQGMDKDNERKVFELLVQTADSSSSQYFLVSPKLLSDLPYSEKMVIHMTYNGPKSEIQWDKVMGQI